MKTIFSLMFISLSAFGQESSPVLDPNKFTVCAITINSDDEKKVFDSQIKKYPSEYNPIVELTKLNGGQDWFKKSCESGIKCDQLLISGHFAGDFFSEDKGKSLTLRELEEASCSKACDGILKNPLEVFLMGCNTLSGKDGDSRTPAQYLQVLLNDGIPLSRAEMVVESRYGSVGDSHKATMQRIFSGRKKQIYGFDSIGPSGKSVKNFLTNYFAQVSAPKRLELLETKRLMNSVEMTNKVLANNLKSTAFTQCPGGDSQDEASKNICALQDKKNSVEKRLDLIHELLGHENYLSYLPAINNFFKDHSPASYTEEQKKELELISNNQVIKDQIIGLINKAQRLGLKMEWMTFAKNVGFISNEEAQKIAKDAFKAGFSKKMDEATLNAIEQLDDSIKNNISFTLDEIKFKNFTAYEAYALSSFNITDPALLKHAENRIKVATTTVDKTALVDLILDKVQKVDATTLNSVKTLLGSKDEYENDCAVRFFTKFSPQDPTYKTKVLNMLNSNTEGVKQTAIEAFQTTKNYSDTIQNSIMSVAKDSKAQDSYTSHVAIKYLIQSPRRDEAFLKQMSDLSKMSHIDSFNKFNIENFLKNQDASNE